MHTLHSLRVHTAQQMWVRGGRQKRAMRIIQVPKWLWPVDQKRPDQTRKGRDRIKTVQCWWVVATLLVVPYASGGAIATAGDIPSWFLRRPCPKEIREDLPPANQCFPPAAETRVRSHHAVLVCHTDHPRRLTGSGPLNLTVLRREANRSLFPVASCSVCGNVYVAIDSNLRFRATVEGSGRFREMIAEIGIAMLLCTSSRYCNV